MSRVSEHAMTQDPVPRVCGPASPPLNRVSEPASTVPSIDGCSPRDHAQLTPPPSSEQDEIQRGSSCSSICSAELTPRPSHSNLCNVGTIRKKCCSTLQKNEKRDCPPAKIARVYPRRKFGELCRNTDKPVCPSPRSFAPDSPGARHLRCCSPSSPQVLLTIDSVSAFFHLPLKVSPHRPSPGCSVSMDAPSCLPCACVPPFVSEGQFALF